MSFWDGVKAVGKGAIEQVNKKQESINKYKEKYEYLDDQALIRKYKGTTGDARYACALLLRERGYTASDL